MGRILSVWSRYAHGAGLEAVEVMLHPLRKTLEAALERLRLLAASGVLRDEEAFAHWGALLTEAKATRTGIKGHFDPAAGAVDKFGRVESVR